MDVVGFGHVITMLAERFPQIIGLVLVNSNSQCVKQAKKDDEAASKHLKKAQDALAEYYKNSRNQKTTLQS